MKNNVYFTLFLLVAVFSSCAVEFEEKNINDQFTMELPSYMIEMNLGVPSAALQYGSDEKEHYIVVMRENPTDLIAYGVTDLETYADSYITAIKIAVDDAVVNRIGSGIEDKNGMQAITYEVDGVLPETGLGMYYYIQFYKSESALYYVCDWTMSDSRAEYLSDMKKITNSLKEL